MAVPPVAPVTHEPGHRTGGIGQDAGGRFPASLFPGTGTGTSRSSSSGRRSTA
ncbi:hypothetical protein [Streptomyces sp. NPDC052042]|uniref:hypothetical protein n=1 Tax=Streptomyces sp. NPDC052042 TaxID=3365683 RepID=UPI0037CDD29E